MTLRDIILSMPEDERGEMDEGDKLILEMCGDITFSEILSFTMTRDTSFLNRIHGKLKIEAIKMMKEKKTCNLF